MVNLWCVVYNLISCTYIRKINLNLFCVIYLFNLCMCLYSFQKVLLFHVIVYGGHWGRTLGIFFPKRLAVKETTRFLRTQKANTEVLAITHWALEKMVCSKVNGLRTMSSRACWTWSASPWWPWGGAARSAGAGSAGRLSVRWCGVMP